jgi:hypothetical protein
MAVLAREAHARLELERVRRCNLIVALRALIPLRTAWCLDINLAIQTMFTHQAREGRLIVNEIQFRGPILPDTVNFSIRTVYHLSLLPSR